MKEDRWKKIESLFEGCRQLPESQRTDYLDRQCTDPELRSEVEQLLRSSQTPDPFLDHPRRAARLVAEEFCEQIGPHEYVDQTIGSFRIRRFLAAGGMGLVYEAHQGGSDRRVALKLMRFGVSSENARRRFEYETRILGRLNHPGIAQIYEAGVHTVALEADLHVPYFAMEFVPDAQPITEYATTKSLADNDRLELFLEVCDAIEHGHQKGIIHRDLKPANLLVGGNGRPKVIDFGVARSTDSDLFASTTLTNPGQLVGTLRYMSPEQCEADPSRLDARSDVFSLGVILYELLLDEFPYDVPSNNVYQAAVAIRESAPHRPTSLQPALATDLETILLKAIEKEPERRYRSAGDLARDLRHYLADEPISARPPGSWETVGRVMRRHRVASVATVLFLVALLLGAAGTTIGYVRATRAESLALIGQEQAKEAQAAAEASEREIEATLQQVEEQARQNQGMFDFLRDTFYAANPRTTGRSPTVEDLLDHAATKLSLVFREDDLTRAEMCEVLATSYHHLQRPEKAEPLMRLAVQDRRRLAPLEQGTFTSMIVFSGMLLSNRKVEEAELVARRAVEDWESSTEEPDHSFAGALGVLARAQLDRGNHDSAEANLLRAISLHRSQGHGSSETMVQLLSLMLVLREHQQRWTEAARYGGEALAIGGQVLPETHPTQVTLRSSLAKMLNQAGNGDSAEQHLRDAVQFSARIFGEDHATHLSTVRDLATLLVTQRKLDEAEQHLQFVIEGQRDGLGDFHPEVAVTQICLGDAFVAMGEFEEAELVYQEAFDLLSEEMGREDERTLHAAYSLASLLLRTGKHEDLESLGVPLLDHAQPPTQRGRNMARALREIVASSLQQTERYREAAKHLQLVLETSRHDLGETHPYTGMIRDRLERLRNQRSPTASDSP